MKETNRLPNRGSTTGKKSALSVSNRLQQTHLRLLGRNDDARCEKAVAFDWNKVYCSTSTRPNVSNAIEVSNVCFGDSGGPMMYYAPQLGNWYLYGITSMVKLNGTSRACDPTQPAYFTSVPAYLDFIAYAIEFLAKK